MVRQRRPLSDLDLSPHRLRETVALGLLPAAVQAAVTLPLITFGSLESWLPLLLLVLVVGLFEAVFFRDYIVAVLEPMFGIAPAVAASAVLYALYHVGYRVGAEEMLFLGGLGLVYAIAYAAARNVFVLWPLLTPVGGLFATVSRGDVEMPMIAILGFVDVLVVMIVAIYPAARRRRRHPPLTSHPFAARRAAALSRRARRPGIVSPCTSEGCRLFYRDRAQRAHIP